MKSLIVSVALLFVVLVPLQTEALGVPFGGKVITGIPCTCNPDGGMLITFGPFFSLGGIPLSFTLYYAPLGSLLHANFAPGIPGTWELGTFTPGAPVCMMALPTIPPSCGPLPFPIPIGKINELGTSLRPGI